MPQKEEKKLTKEIAHRPGKGHQGLVKRADAALLIIDMQEKLVPAMTEPTKIVENIKRLVALARLLRLPVIITEQEKLGPTIEEIRDEIPEAEVIGKVSFNCFMNERCVEKIRETGRNTLIVSGIEAHICVAQTAISASAEGFCVHVVSDAVSSRAPDNLTVALDRMRTSGVTITSTEMIIYELLERAGTEEFRSMLPLIK
jgi:nicotinamidase-related amidase